MESEINQILDQVESAWRNALSLCLQDNPDQAAKEVAAAERLLATLQGHRPRPEQAPEIKERMAKLHLLHNELIKQASAGQARVEQQLAAAKQGGKTLKAYSSGQTIGRLDKVI